MKTSFSIRTRLVAAFVGVALITTVVIALVANSVFTTQATELLGQDLKAISDSTAKQTGVILEQNVDRLSVLALNRFIQDSVDTANLEGTSNVSELTAIDTEWANASPSSTLVGSVLNNEIANELNEFRSRYPSMLELFITDRYGAIIASTDKTSDYYQADEEWWQSAWNNGTGGIYISQPGYDESAQSFAVDIAFPIRGHTRNDVIGVIRTTVDVSEFSTILTNARFGETGRTDMYFAEGQFLSDDLSKGLLTAPPETVAALNGISGNFSEINYEGSVSFVSRSQITSKDTDFSEVINNLGWYAVAHQDRTETLTPAIQTTRLIALVSLGLLLVVALISYVLSSTLTRPILSLTVAADRLAQGEIDTDVKVESRDEIGALAETFNNMSAQLRNSISTLEQRVAERTKALSNVADISTETSSIQNLDEMLANFVHLTQRKFGLYHAHVFLYDETEENLRIMACGWKEGDEHQGTHGTTTIPIAQAQSLVARAARSRKPVTVNDVHNEPGWLPNPLLPDTKSEVAIPMVVGDRLIGVLDVQSDHLNAFTEADVDIQLTLSSQIAVAIQNILQFQNSQKIANDLGVVAQVGIATATITDIDKLLQEVVDISKESFRLYHAHIYMLNPEGDTLQLTAGAGEVGRQMVSEGRSIPLDSEKSLVARAARTQQGVVVNDITEDPDFLPNPLLPKTRAEMAVPMLVGGNRLIGVLDVQSETIGRFTSVDVNIKTTLASQIAIAVQNARTFEEAKRTAEREAAVNLIAQRIQSATSVESALQVAARELGHALGMKPTAITLAPAATESRTE